MARRREGYEASGRAIAEIYRDRTKRTYREFRLQARPDELTRRERQERERDIWEDDRMEPQRKAELEAMVGRRVRFKERHVGWDGTTVYKPRQEFRVIARAFDRLELFVPPGGWKRPAMRLVVPLEWLDVVEEENGDE